MLNSTMKFQLLIKTKMMKRDFSCYKYVRCVYHTNNVNMLKFGISTIMRMIMLCLVELSMNKGLMGKQRKYFIITLYYRINYNYYMLVALTY